MTTGKFRPAIRKPRTTSPVSMAPHAVAQAYNFPQADGSGYVGGIIELGGGYKQSQVSKYFQAVGLPTPTFTTVEVEGGRNKPDGPDGADGEVQLDMIVAGAVAPAAAFRVYFAPNDDHGFLAALQQACRECHGISISWGGPEDSWDPQVQDQFEATIAAARQAGVPVFVAAGDTGSRDGEGHPVVDFPASAPSAVGCGGTRLLLDDKGGRASEVVWDDDDLQSATGGGVSVKFPGRQVPDVAANADPDTGYQILVDGKRMVVGGTSAVAPLMLGLHALLWQVNGGKGFDFLNLVVTNPQALFDVTLGSNGDYRAGPGRDETTGFGVPDGTKLNDALLGPVPPPAVPSPTPPTPAPGPTVPPQGNPLAEFPVKTVQAWLTHKHTYSHVEAAAARSISQWAASFGIVVGPADQSASTR